MLMKTVLVLAVVALIAGVEIEVTWRYLCKRNRHLHPQSTNPRSHRYSAWCLLAIVYELCFFAAMK